MLRPFASIRYARPLGCWLRHRATVLDACCVFCMSLSVAGLDCDFLFTSRQVAQCCPFSLDAARVLFDSGVLIAQ